MQTSSRASKRPYNPALDGLRGIAILLVVLFHLNLPWTSGGFLGVDVFFVLSGFLITQRLAQDLEDQGRIRLTLFYIRRALRLFPALTVVLAVGTLWAYLFFPPALRSTTRRGATAAALYYANWLHVKDGELGLGAFGHTWSLSLEEQFYAVWPLLLMVAYRVDRRGLAVRVAAALLPFYRIGLLFLGASLWRLYNGFDTHCDGLVLGAALARAVERKEIRGTLTRVAPWFSIVGAAAVLFLCASITYQRRITYIAVIPLVNVISVAAILTTIVRPSSVVNRFLSIGVLRWLGRMSYSLYLWHLPILVASRSLPFHGGHETLAALLSILAASASYYWIERPALRLKEYFEGPRVPRAATADRPPP